MQPASVTDITRALKESDGGALGSAIGSDIATDDAHLMMRYRGGDLSAFQTLYTRHKAPLYRYLQRTLQGREAANDVFQEVWSKVIASRSSYEPKAQFSTFLYRVAHNCAIDHFRRSARQHEARTQEIGELAEEIPAAQDLPEDVLAHAQLQASFRRALDELPLEQREVFVLYEESGLSLDVIGRITGVAMETAKSRLRYAVGKLRTALKVHHVGESA